MAIHLTKSGALVTVHYNHSAEEAKSLQKQIGCELLQADFSTIPVPLLRTLLEKNKIEADVLINNASNFRKCLWNEVDENEWDEQMNVHLKIPFFLSQYFGERMKRNGLGKILNIVDIAAQRPYPSYLPYSIAKAGLVTATQGFALSLAPEVQVNAIAPGTILFPDDVPEETRAKLINKIPAKRTGTTEEFLRTVDFLLVDADYITGQTIVLDGGRSLSW
jgi:NAD(P)-dependent dehydrogenase (short-subunit alcohol dehydrogenase family)